MSPFASENRQTPKVRSFIDLFASISSCNLEHRTLTIASVVAGIIWAKGLMLIAFGKFLSLNCLRGLLKRCPHHDSVSWQDDLQIGPT